MTFVPKMWTKPTSKARHSHVVMECTEHCYVSWTEVLPETILLSRPSQQHIPGTPELQRKYQAFAQQRHPWWSPDMKPCYLWDAITETWCPTDECDECDEDASIVVPSLVPGFVPGFVPQILETIDARDPYGAYNVTFGHTGSQACIDMPKINERIRYY